MERQPGHEITAKNAKPNCYHWFNQLRVYSDPLSLFENRHQHKEVQKKKGENPVTNFT